MEINFIGEDRTFGGNELFIDLIPQTSWFKNVRSCFSKKDWDIIRKYIYQRTNYICECCGKDCSNTKDIEAHERWLYDELTSTQKLIRIIALCKKCHMSTHYGLANILGKTKEINEHIKKVKNIDEEELIEHIDEAYKIWNLRNMFQWNLDLSLIESSGFKIKKIL